MMKLPHIKLAAMALVISTALLFGLTPAAFAVQNGDAQLSGTNATLVTMDSKAKSAVDISKAKVSKISNQKYTGKAIKPIPKVKYKGKALKNGRDFTLSYKSNKKAGTAKVIIKGKGNFAGKKTVTFAIKKSSANKKNSSSGTVYVTNTGLKYHRGSCRWLYASKIPMSKKEAVAEGYEPCKVCRP